MSNAISLRAAQHEWDNASDDHRFDGETVPVTCWECDGPVSETEAEAKRPVCACCRAEIAAERGLAKTSVASFGKAVAS